MLTEPLAEAQRTCGWCAAHECGPCVGVGAESVALLHTCWGPCSGGAVELPRVLDPAGRILCAAAGNYHVCTGLAWPDAHPCPCILSEVVGHQHGGPSQPAVPRIASLIPFPPSCAIT